MTPGDLKEISISRILHFVQGVVLHKKLTMVKVHGLLQCQPNGTLFYSTKCTALLRTYYTLSHYLKLLRLPEQLHSAFKKFWLKSLQLSVLYIWHLFLIYALSLIFLPYKSSQTKKHTPFFNSSSNCSLWNSLTETCLPIHQGKQVLCFQSGCNFN